MQRLREATKRAERAEQEVAWLKNHTEKRVEVQATGGGEAELRKDAIYDDISHYQEPKTNAE